MSLQGLLGPELVPNTDFDEWDGAAIPDNFPVNWTVQNNDANNYVEPGVTSPDRHLHMTSDGIDEDSPRIYRTFDVIVGRMYVITYEYSAKAAGRAQAIGALSTYTMAADVGVRTESHILTANSQLLFLRHGDAVPQDWTLSFFSVKEVIAPAGRSTRSEGITGINAATPAIESACGHGVDVQISGTISAGGVDLERATSMSSTWKLVQSFSAPGGFRNPRQSGWLYRLKTDGSFSGNITMSLRQI